MPWLNPADGARRARSSNSSTNEAGSGAGSKRRVIRRRRMTTSTDEPVTPAPMATSANAISTAFNRPQAIPSSKPKTIKNTTALSRERVSKVNKATVTTPTIRIRSNQTNPSVIASQAPVDRAIHSRFRNATRYSPPGDNLWCWPASRGPR